MNLEDNKNKLPEPIDCFLQKWIQKELTKLILSEFAMPLLNLIVPL